MNGSSASTPLSTMSLIGMVGASIAALAFVLALVAETRGRSLELIETNLAGTVRDLGMPLPARSLGG
jgi:hypothetical protein